MFTITHRGKHDGPFTDRNARNKQARLAPKPSSKPLFGFDKMQPGDWFYIEFERGREASMRTMLHQNARLAGIWIETNVNKGNAKTTTMWVRHDGKRD